MKRFYLPDEVPGWGSCIFFFLIFSDIFTFTWLHCTSFPRHEGPYLGNLINRIPDWLILILIYLLTAIGLTPGGSSTVHIYTQTVHRTTQLTTLVGRLRTQSGKNNWEECGPCPVFASYTLAFVLQLRKKHGKTSVRVAEECQLVRWKQNI
jgi:hypothetical protein